MPRPCVPGTADAAITRAQTQPDGAGFVRSAISAGFDEDAVARGLLVQHPAIVVRHDLDEPLQARLPVFEDPGGDARAGARMVLVDQLAQLDLVAFVDLLERDGGRVHAPRLEVAELVV